jgi:hypothetical protein
VTGAAQFKNQWVSFSGRLRDQWVFYFWILICLISILFAFVGSIFAPKILGFTQEISWAIHKVVWHLGETAAPPNLQLWHYWEFAAFFSTFAFNLLFFYVGWFYGKKEVKGPSGQVFFMRGRFVFQHQSQSQIIWIVIWFALAFLALFLATAVSVVDGACWIQVLCVLGVTYCFLKIDRIMVTHAEDPEVKKDFSSSVKLNDQPAVLAFCVLLAFAYLRFPLQDAVRGTQFRGFIGGAIAFQMLLSNTVLALIFQKKREDKERHMSWMVRLLLLLLIGGFILGGWIMRGGESRTSDASLLGRPLRVGIVSWPGYAGGIVANNGFKPNDQCIFWNKYKLRVEFILLEDVDARAKAFARGGPGGIDITWSTVDFWAYELPGLLNNGVSARAVMQVDWSRGGDAIVVDKSIGSIEDLKGKKISLALFTPSHWLLEYSLEHSGLSDADQDQIVKNIVGKNASPDARQDFVAGKVDAAVVWEPDVTAALKERQGSHSVKSSMDFPNIIADIMVAREEFINQHPDVIEAFIRGWLDGTEEANRNNDLVVTLLRQNESLYESLGPTVTKEGLNTVKWADLSDNVKMFGLDGSRPIFDRIFTEAGTAWKKRNYIEEARAPNVAKEDRFLRKILSSSSSAAH